tara:strand:+ start:904 stop:1278 length:375 start_codon:yes stop_codon:yes gene_type:complete
MYTIKQYAEQLAKEVGQGFTSPDSRWSALEQAKRTNYLANGDRRKWCDGCGGRSIQEREWDCDEAPSWTCSSCGHSVPRKLQSSEAIERRQARKAEKRAAKWAAFNALSTYDQMNQMEGFLKSI